MRCCRYLYNTTQDVPFVVDLFERWERVRQVATLCPNTHQARHPPVLRACGLPSHCGFRRLPHPSLLRPRTHSPPQAALAHSPNLHLQRWTIPVNLPIALLNANLIYFARMPRHPGVGFCSDSVYCPQPPFSHRSPSCPGSSFSLRPCSLPTFSSPTS